MPIFAAAVRDNRATIEWLEGRCTWVGDAAKVDVNSEVDRSGMEEEGSQQLLEDRRRFCIYPSPRIIRNHVINSSLGAWRGRGSVPDVIVLLGSWVV